MCTMCCMWMYFVKSKVLQTTKSKSKSEQDKGKPNWLSPTKKKKKKKIRNQVGSKWKMSLNVNQTNQYIIHIWERNNRIRLQICHKAINNTACLLIVRAARRTDKYRPCKQSKIVACDKIMGPEPIFKKYKIKTNRNL